MQRGSDKHSAWKDDALARDVEDMIRSTGPTDAQEWKDPEPPAADGLTELPIEVDLADAVEQHSSLGDDDAEYYPRSEQISRPGE